MTATDSWIDTWTDDELYDELRRRSDAHDAADPDCGAAEECDSFLDLILRQIQGRRAEAYMREQGLVWDDVLGQFVPAKGRRPLPLREAAGLAGKAEMLLYGHPCDTSLDGRCRLHEVADLAARIRRLA